MRFKALERHGDGRPILVMERSILGFIKFPKRFLAAKEIAIGFYTWLSLPDLELVGDAASFRLDRVLAGALKKETK